MQKELNKVKVLGELMFVLITVNDLKTGFEYKRYSPATKDVIDMLETAVRACQEAVRNGHPLMFEINVWEQQAISGWGINLADEEAERE